MKIALIFSIPVSYRIPLFNILSTKYNLTVLFSRAHKLTDNMTFPYFILPHVPIPLTSRYGENVYGYPEFPYTLFFNLIKGEYDLIIAKNINTIPTWIAFLSSRIQRKPFIIWEETWYLGSGILRKILSSLWTYLLKYADAIIVPGSKSKEYILSFNVNKEKVFVAPNASLSYNYVSNKMQIAYLQKKNLKGDKIILYLGRLIERKGIEYLIKSFALVQKKVNNCTLLIAGKGENQKKLQLMCKTLNLSNVKFLGYVDENEKNLLYNIADVFVLPSVTTKGLAEFWGLTINEAMSAKKPVICTTAVGGAYDLIINGFNGYVVKERNYEDLAESLLKILKNSSGMKDAMGKNSEKIIKNYFTYERMTNGFINAINYVSNKKREDLKYEIL